MKLALKLIVGFIAVSLLVGFVGIGHNITMRKKTEEQLKEKINELEKYKRITVDRELKMIEFQI